MQDNNTKNKLLPWLGAGLFLVLTIAIYLLPHKQTESMLCHSWIITALKSGNLWGRQAFTSILDYPLLQNLAMLTCDCIASTLRLDAGRLLCAIAQSLVLLRFIMLFLPRKNWYCLLLPIAIAALLPTVSVSFRMLDPAWVAVVPAAAVFYRIAKEDNSLKSLMMSAIDSSLLLLCGIPAAVMGLTFLIFLDIRQKAICKKDGIPYAGMPTIIWIAPAYCIAVMLIANWLIMDDPVFPLYDILPRLLSLQTKVLRAIVCTPFNFCMFVFLFPMFILCMKTECKPLARLVIIQAILLIVSDIMLKLMKLPSTGIEPLAILVIMEAVTLLATSKFTNPVPRNACIMAFICCIYASFRAEHLHNLSTYSEHMSLPPSPEKITEYIDQFWPMSRTFIIGKKMPMFFNDPKEKRFVSRLDFQEQCILEQSIQEQMHLLVPPTDGIFCPAGNHPLTEIHEHGRQWLLLEKEWADGWQLWRVGIAPGNDSKLDFLRKTEQEK